MGFHGGGGAPRLGTNPLAFAAPVAGRPALVVDLATSAVARGRIVAAQKAGRPIPEGWAVDAGGAPTTDAAAALEGALLPLGGAKGSALALMVEVLAAALTGSAFGWEASSAGARTSSPSPWQGRNSWRRCAVPGRVPGRRGRSPPRCGGATGCARRRGPIR